MPMPRINALLLLAVATPAMAQASQWRLVEEVRVGTADGAEAYAFSPGPLVAARADGTVFVADGGALEVRVFDARGRHLRSFGRRGAGPGEFLAVGEMGWRADTLWVTDPMQLRTTLFTLDGRVVRTIGAVTRATGEYMPAGAWALLANGAVLARPGGAQRTEGGIPLLHRLPLLRIDPATERTDTLAWRELRNRMLRVPDGRSLLTLVQPWDDTPLFAVAADGSSVVRVDRALPEGGEPVFRVTRFSPEGRRLFSRVFRYPPVPIEAGWRREWGAKMARDIAEVRPVGNVRALADVLAREVFVPAVMPPVTAVVAGTDGTVWLRREERGGATVEWLVLDASGRLSASVRTPAGLTVQQASRTHVWGTITDDLDVPYVLRFRVEPMRR